MKIHSVNKVVKVYVEVITAIDDFRVNEKGDVVKFVEYADGDASWTYYGDVEDYHAEIREAGMKMLHFNKGV